MTRSQAVVVLLVAIFAPAVVCWREHLWLLAVCWVAVTGWTCVEHAIHRLRGAPPMKDRP